MNDADAPRTETQLCTSFKFALRKQRFALLVVFSTRLFSGRQRGTGCAVGFAHWVWCGGGVCYCHGGAVAILCI